MRDDDRVRLRHMIEAAESALQFAAGRQRSELDSNRMLLFALVRAIEIVGEAASRMSDETRAAETAIPWKSIVGMRNRLVHAYFEIDADLVWVAVTVEIPALLSLLQPLAEKE